MEGDFWVLLVRRPVALLVMLQAGLWFATGTSGSRVIGGWEAKPHSRPFMASIQLNGEHFCGGFLVRKRWVMTAAHCDIPRRTPSVRVVLGAHSLKMPEASQQIFGVAESLAHPQYDPKTVQNDIRLLKLNGSAVLNPSVRRIRLPPTNSDLTPGDTCQVIGWGDVSNFGTAPTALMEVNMTVIERSACNASWTGHVYSCMLCAAYPGRRLRGFCSGDSGGPLVRGTRVHGIVSFNSKRCGNPRYPDVYTRISRYITWVRCVVQMF
nr:serine protease 57 [Pogona vitticeps]